MTRQEEDLIILTAAMKTVELITADEVAKINVSSEYVGLSKEDLCKKIEAKVITEADEIIFRVYGRRLKSLWS